ncbi:MAG TPA: IS630 family transposase [Geminicoccaceae bacterium]|nr:IS630 family transposase [Geminicoccaceae bacterium]
MEARDFRGLGRPAQEALRRRALFLIEHEGMTRAEAALAAGVHRQTVNIWRQRYRERGEDGLLDGRRVSPRRGQGRLTEDEARQVRDRIAEGTPDRLELPFALWTSRAVRELIERRLEKRLGLSTVQLYLRRWGLTPQKPLVRAKQRQPAAIAAWLETAYPAIAKRARAARAVIYWGDETGISNQDQIGRSYAPRGETPVIARTAKRVTQGMISAVSNRGLMRFMLYQGALTADRFIAFLRRLIKDAGRKVLLIVDNLKVHKAGKVQAWAESHRHEIELFYLPAYAPDHNPTEYLNNDLKQKLRQQPQPGSKEELIKSARSVLRAIQRSPRRVRAYFKPEPVRYAA